MGMYDVDQFTAIINQPNSAILAVGAIVKKPVVKNDQIVIAERMRITMTSDHRIVYGADAALFLRDLKRLLEQPLLLMV
jgi:pyruvate dehydrogenase E2 component (dihydrolipoamide acetyltransferase)